MHNKDADQSAPVLEQLACAARLEVVQQRFPAGGDRLRSVLKWGMGLRWSKELTPLAFGVTWAELLVDYVASGGTLMRANQK